MKFYTTSKAFALPLLILLCITSCKKNTETISTGMVSNGVYILKLNGMTQKIVIR